MHTTLNQNHTNNLFIVAGFAITVIALVILAVAPSIVTPIPALIPVTADEEAHVEYLRGEKVLYANPVARSEALSAYHLGEKTPFETALDMDSALSQFLAGEKVLFENPMDLNAAVTAYHLGEKFVAQGIESAMWEYRRGEWNLK